MFSKLKYYASIIKLCQDCFMSTNKLFYINFSLNKHEKLLRDKSLFIGK